MDNPRCCGKAMAYLHKTRGHAASTKMTIVSSVWNCIYCDSKLAVPEKWIKDVPQETNHKNIVVSER